MMLTFSGRLIDPVHPNLDDVELLDIAFGLAHVFRWGGHACPSVTVAQHTLAGAMFLRESKGRPLDALAFLHHDDGEAFMGDMPRELKHAPEMRWYREREEELSTRLRLHFAPVTIHANMKRVKDVDNHSLHGEWIERMMPEAGVQTWAGSAAGLSRGWYQNTGTETVAQWLRMHSLLTRETAK